MTMELFKVTYQTPEETEVSFYTTWNGVAMTIGYRHYAHMQNVAEKGENGAYMVSVNRNVVHGNDLITRYEYLVWNQTKEKALLARDREAAKRILRNLGK